MDEETGLPSIREGSEGSLHESSGTMASLHESSGTTATLMRGSHEGGNPIFIEKQQGPTAVTSAAANTTTPVREADVQSSSDGNVSEKAHRFERRSVGGGAGVFSPLSSLASPTSDGDDHSRASPPNMMSDASKMFDRDNKGYLDPTERALRDLDSDNDGKLTVRDVYDLMTSLQEAQKLSNDLMESLQREQKTALNLKKAVLGLVLFALLLSVANIGTSFAAARLAKDTEIATATGDLVAIDSQQRVGTTNKMQALTLQPIPNAERRRRLQLGLDYCSGIFNITHNTTGRFCTEAATLKYDSAFDMYRQLCPAWTSLGQACPSLTGGVDRLYLTCQSKPNVIMGGAQLPMQGPGFKQNPATRANEIYFPAVFDEDHENRTILYQGHQWVRDPVTTQCAQAFELQLICEFGNNNDDCLVIALLDDQRCQAFDPAINPDYEFHLCDDPTPAERRERQLMLEL